MRTLRWALIVLAIAGLAQVVAYRSTSSHGADGEVIASTVQFGLPWSPWYHREQHATGAGAGGGAGGGGGGATVNIYPFSWSTSAALGGAGCLIAAIGLRRRRGKA